MPRGTPPARDRQKQSEAQSHRGPALTDHLGSTFAPPAGDQPPRPPAIWKSREHATKFALLERVVDVAEKLRGTEALVPHLRAMQGAEIKTDARDPTVLLAFGLGAAAGLGAALAARDRGPAAVFGAYLALLAAFHALEYLFCYLFHQDELSADAFLLEQSGFCQAVVASSVVEFGLEWALAPAIKQPRSLITGAGLAAALVGQTIRSLAMYQGGVAFTHHIVEERERPEHRLVVDGVYRVFRHPGYFGWMLWAVGSQVMLTNPVCTVIYAVCAWRFFRKRIPYEERTLLRIFGRDYEQYRKKTPTWMPFIP